MKHFILCLAFASSCIVTISAQNTEQVLVRDFPVKRQFLFGIYEANPLIMLGELKFLSFNGSAQIQSQVDSILIKGIIVACPYFSGGINAAQDSIALERCSQETSEVDAIAMVVHRLESGKYRVKRNTKTSITLNEMQAIGFAIQPNDSEMFVLFRAREWGPIVVKFSVKH